MEVLDKIPDVHLDAGTFKYVLISATFNGAQKHIVRGFEGPKYEYHIDVFNECVRQARDMLPEDGEDGSPPWRRCDGALSSRKQTTQRPLRLCLQCNLLASVVAEYSTNLVTSLSLSTDTLLRSARPITPQRLHYATTATARNTKLRLATRAIDVACC